MTTSGEADLSRIVPPEGFGKQGTPCTIHYSDVIDHDQDNIDLVNFMQMHECSGYCLRTQGKK